MRLITDNDRSYILAQLTNASDEVLVRAYQDWDAQRLAALEVRASIGSSAAQPKQQAHVEQQAQHAEPEPRQRTNASPGPSSITRIGGTTKDELLRMLEHGAQPPAKYNEHLKLLWERGEVRFDGEEWYV